MLPQRRKSAEEIAKLRETMGVPGAPREQVPLIEKTPASSLFEPAPEADRTPLPEPKPVRSLRKSENMPVERKSAAPRDKSAAIPVRRHSDRELMEMRRVQVAPPDQAIAYIQHLAVPWPWVALGYLLPLFGALAGWFAASSPGVPEPDFPAEWIANLSRQPWLGTAGFSALAAFCALGVALASWIAMRKPRSRHHAGFITILTILIAVFAIIHQFTPSHAP